VSIIDLICDLTDEFKTCAAHVTGAVSYSYLYPGDVPVVKLVRNLLISSLPPRRTNFYAHRSINGQVNQKH
jgi:hypothetical protein